jgi:2-polyprenyl-3-methyl-5-hydroxy-6-metoxy-1,4-benzoquinol methylase
MPTEREYYGRKLKQYGADYRSLGYKSQESQEQRFQVLAEIGDLNHKSILDVGCGLGHFYDFLGRHLNGRKDVNYTGIDIMPELISHAREIYPKAKFEVRNLSWDSMDEKFDYVLACSVFNIEHSNWLERTFRMLRAMFDTCKIGMGVTFLSVLSPNGLRPDRHYTHPSTIMSHIGDALTTKMTMRHDYRDNDFTVYAYK